MLKTVRYFFTRIYTIISIVLFIFTYTALKVGAIYYPTDNITNPSCAPGDSGCYVSLLPDQTSNSGSLLFTNGTNPSWTSPSALSWDSVNGRLGVGTSTPITSLDVYSSSFRQMTVRGGNNASQVLNFGTVANTVGSYISNNSYYHSSFNFTPGYTASSGMMFRQDGSIEFFADTGLTSDVDYNPSERMYISNTGNVGIGVSGGPLSQPLVVGRVGALPETSGATSSAHLKLFDTSSSSMYFGVNHSSPNQGWIQMSANANMSQTFPLLLNPNGGNVGIGTTSPSLAMHIVGNANQLRLDNGSVTLDIKNSGNTIWDFVPTSANGTDSQILRFFRNTNTVGVTSIDLTAGDNTSGSKVRISGNSNSWFNAAGGSLGVGTTTPDSYSKLNIVDTLTNSGSTGLYIQKTAVISGIGYGQYTIVSGASTTNVGGYFSATGATNNYGLVVASGNVGIGTITPSANLHIEPSGGSGEVWQWIKNSRDTASVASLYVENNSGMNIALKSYGSTYASTIFGVAAANTMSIMAGGANNGLFIGHSGNSKPIIFGQGSVENMRITATTGNLGIGNSSPISRLSNSSTNIVDFASSRNVDDLGIVWKIASTGAKYVAGFENTTNSTGAGGVVIRTVNTNGGTYLLQLVANSTEVASFTGDGNAFKPGGGSFTATSDQRAKKDISSLGLGLDAINSLNPVTFKYNGLYPTAPDNGKTYVGLIAQDVIGTPLEQYLVSTDENNGLYRLDPSAIPFALVGAIKELDIKVNQLSSLDTTLTGSFGYLAKEFLGNASNSITDLYAKVVHSDKVETKELCTTDGICLSENDIRNLYQISQERNQPNQQVTPENPPIEELPPEEVIPQENVEEIVE